MKDEPMRPTPTWKTSPTPVAYQDAMATMNAHVEGILASQEEELVWLLEHPPLYTTGTSARAEDIRNPLGLPVFESGRGGQVTYHGPGQRIAYVMMDLAARDRDLRAHVWRLEEWAIRALSDFDFKGERRKGRIGIWVEQNGVEKKIAALGVRARRWVTSHGIAINVDVDLAPYAGIVPCGLPDFGITSLRALGLSATLADLDAALARHFPSVFTP